ncbi:hypothetical protein CBOM_07004 [Ceraceosorus bombacis]|uniref:Uncharacterized protein n=1 Tax=Ceraceosorus bombacis TaxID=401625 RepID=A0A0P1BLH5_9BASI|nr:hypothetical protein CBOM_07004 [Ceraceosorus bombacis]
MQFPQPQVPGQDGQGGYQHQAPYLPAGSNAPYPPPTAPSGGYPSYAPPSYDQPGQSQSSRPPPRAPQRRTTIDDRGPVNIDPTTKPAPSTDEDSAVDASLGKLELEASQYVKPPAYFSGKTVFDDGIFRSVDAAGKWPPTTNGEALEPTLKSWLTQMGEHLKHNPQHIYTLTHKDVFALKDSDLLDYKLLVQMGLRSWYTAFFHEEERKKWQNQLEELQAETLPRVEGQSDELNQDALDWNSWNMAFRYSFSAKFKGGKGVDLFKGSPISEMGKPLWKWKQKDFAAREQEGEKREVQMVFRRETLRDELKFPWKGKQYVWESNQHHRSFAGARWDATTIGLYEESPRRLVGWFRFLEEKAAREKDYTLDILDPTLDQAIVFVTFSAFWRQAWEWMTHGYATSTVTATLPTYKKLLDDPGAKHTYGILTLEKYHEAEEIAKQESLPSKQGDNGAAAINAVTASIVSSF